jgi:hypothetical protein
LNSTGFEQIDKYAKLINQNENETNLKLLQNQLIFRLTFLNCLIY